MLKTAENQELGAECEHDLYSQTLPLLSSVTFRPSFLHAGLQRGLGV